MYHSIHKNIKQNHCFQHFISLDILFYSCDGKAGY